MITVSHDFSYETAVNNIAEMKRRFSFADFSVVGRTWCSRAMFSMSIGEGNESVLLVGGVRGQEWLTPAVLFRFFERLCIAYQNDMKISAVKIRNILKERKIIVLPLVNPDALEIATLGKEGAGCYRGLVECAAEDDYSQWNSNARGVDIDKNFAYHFPVYPKISEPSPLDYAGPLPFSEPETKAIENLCLNERIKHVIRLSSAGEKIYFNSKAPDTDTAMMAQIFKSVCDYSIGRKTENEKSGGLCEWFTEETGKPSFEIKIGKGENPLPFDSLDSTYQKIEELLVLASIM